jgi:hypothetical protein
MKYAGQKLNAARTERAVKRLQNAKPRTKKHFTKLDILLARKKASMQKES